jgi:hypothetical protein
MKCYEVFLKKIFQHPAFPFWMDDVSPIRSYISGLLKPFIPTATAAFLLFAPGAASFAAEPQATPIPEIHRVADIFQPLSRSAELLLEPTHLAGFGIFIVVIAVMACVLIKFRPRGPEDHLEEPPQVYGSCKIEMAKTVIPCLIVFVLVLVSARSTVEIQNQPMSEDTLKIRLIVHQWWWKIQYPDLGIITANEIHEPVSSKLGKTRRNHTILESAANTPENLHAWLFDPDSLKPSCYMSVLHG